MARLDEGLQQWRREWWEEHPGATVYWIADSNHSTNPRTSQHAPDDGKSGGPGDTPGEVDAVDAMTGKGVTFEHLEDAAENLRKSRDPRILIVILGKRIFSSYAANGYPAFTWRPYSGNYHGHLHISVNDKFANNQSDWKWENVAARKIEYKTVEGAKLPELQVGDDDAAQDGWNHVGRAQALLNFQHPSEPLEVDGNYGAKTTARVAKVFGTNGKKLDITLMKKLHGIS